MAKRKQKLHNGQDVRNAFLRVLHHTLVYIRLKASNPRVAFILSDHAHNIPGLIEKFSVDQFRYYWEIERIIFLREMRALNESVQRFEVYWQTLERFYQNLPPELDRK